MYPGSISDTGVLQDFHQVSNLLLAAKFKEVLRKNAAFFYPYTVHDDDRPDIIAHKYYGSPNYTWVIFFTNNIVDPLYDWVLPYPDFIDYLKAKYGSLEYTHQNVKYRYNNRGYIIDEETYNSLAANEKETETIYEWENRLNEAKRNIQLLEDMHLNKVLSEFRTIMREARK